MQCVAEEHPPTGAYIAVDASQTAHFPRRNTLLEPVLCAQARREKTPLMLAAGHRNGVFAKKVALLSDRKELVTLPTADMGA